MRIPCKCRSSLVTLPNLRPIRVACPGSLESNILVPFITCSTVATNARTYPGPTLGGEDAARTRSRDDRATQGGHWVPQQLHAPGRFASGPELKRETPLLLGHLVHCSVSNLQPSAFSLRPFLLGGWFKWPMFGLRTCFLQDGFDLCDDVAVFGSHIVRFTEIGLEIVQLNRLPGAWADRLPILKPDGLAEPRS